MLYKVPPNPFQNVLNYKICCIIFFNNPQNVYHREIYNSICEKAMASRYVLCVEILFNFPDHIRYFPHITDSRIILFMRDNKIYGRCIITELSQIETIFKYYFFIERERSVLFNLGNLSLRILSSIASRVHNGYYHDLIQRINVFYYNKVTF